MADPRLRTLKIKTGIVKRLTKEKISYELESEQQKKRIERMRSEGIWQRVLESVSESISCQWKFSLALIYPTVAMTLGAVRF